MQAYKLQLNDDISSDLGSTRAIEHWLRHQIEHEHSSAALVVRSVLEGEVIELSCDEHSASRIKSLPSVSAIEKDSARNVMLDFPQPVRAGF